jgi:hypothetical protein
VNAGAAIFGRLTNATSAQARVYPLLLPQQPTFPAITYQQVSAVRLHAMGDDSTIVTARVQINSWARTYAEVRTLANEVEALLSRFRGTVGGLQVLDVLLDNEIELYESDTQTRRVVQDVTVYLSPA